MARKPAPPGADRRQLILEAALDVFAEQGFQGATTKEIAARASVTHGLIYFYFASKEDLFQAVFEHSLRGALEELSLPGAAESGEEPAVVIERSVARLLEILSSPRASSLARIMMRMAANDEGKAGPLRECKLSMTRAIGSFASAFTAYLDTQIASGRLRPVNSRAAVTLLIGGVIATFRSGELCPLGEEAERMRNAREWARALCDVVLGGLEPRSSPEAAPPPAVAVAMPADP
ncbi:MAG TPA: TetR family transcriptional regulator [Ktedonobacterales bacterium]|nr:TetR family transcriptional regulator [Ktedonobacterales bacterium]